MKYILLILVYTTYGMGSSTIEFPNKEVCLEASKNLELKVVSKSYCIEINTGNFVK